MLLNAIRNVIVTNQVQAKLIDEDDVATEKVQQFLKNFTYLKDKFENIVSSSYFEGQLKSGENFNIPVLEISKVSETIRKLVVKYDIPEKTPKEDVILIIEEANRLEKEMQAMEEGTDTFIQLHTKLSKAYEEHHSDAIYEYLQILHDTLGFKLPFRF